MPMHPLDKEWRPGQCLREDSRGPHTGGRTRKWRAVWRAATTSRKDITSCAVNRYPAMQLSASSYRYRHPSNVANCIRLRPPCQLAMLALHVLPQRPRPSLHIFGIRPRPASCRTPRPSAISMPIAGRCSRRRSITVLRFWAGEAAALHLKGNFWNISIGAKRVPISGRAIGKPLQRPPPPQSWVTARGPPFWPASTRRAGARWDTTILGQFPCCRNG